MSGIGEGGAVHAGTGGFHVFPGSASEKEPGTYIRKVSKPETGPRSMYTNLC